MSPMAEPLITPSRALILGLADAEGRLDAGPLYAVAEAVGFTTTTIRLALRRLVESGLAESDGRGRKATVQLTAAGLSERLPDLTWVAAAHRVDAGLDSWDGYWHLASFEIPESNRNARDAVRSRITELHGAPLGGALYVSPHPWAPWIDAVAADHGVSERMTMITATEIRHRGSTDLATVTRSLWPVEELAVDYRTFVDRWRHLPTSTDQAVAVRTAFEVSAEIENLLRRDPLLPAKLLPPRFAGPEARALYLDLLTTLGRDSLVAEANIYTVYQTAIDRALDQSAEEFWAEAFANVGAIRG